MTKKWGFFPNSWSDFWTFLIIFRPWMQVRCKKQGWKKCQVLWLYRKKIKIAVFWKFFKKKNGLFCQKREKKIRGFEAAGSTILAIFFLLFWPCKKCAFSCTPGTRVYPLFQKSLSWFGTFQKFNFQKFQFFFDFSIYRGFPEVKWQKTVIFWSFSDPPFLRVFSIFEFSHWEYLLNIDFLTCFKTGQKSAIFDPFFRPPFFWPPFFRPFCHYPVNF